MKVSNQNALKKIRSRSNTNDVNFQSLTTKEIVKTILNSDKQSSLQFLYQDKHKQQRSLKSAKQILDLQQLNSNENEMIKKKYQSNDFIVEQPQYKQEDILNISKEQDKSKDNCNQISSDNIIINRKNNRITEYLQHLYSNRIRNSLSQHDIQSEVNPNKEVQENLLSSRQNVRTTCLEEVDKNNIKQQRQLNETYQSNNKELDQQPQQPYYKVINYKQFDFEKQSCTSNSDQKMNPQINNPFLRKNSRIHKIRRSLIDMFNSQSRKQSPDGNKFIQIKQKSFLGELKHSVSQGEIVQSINDRKSFNQEILSQITKYKMDYHLQPPTCFQEKTMSNTQRSSLQDLLNKKKQEKCNQILLGFNSQEINPNLQSRSKDLLIKQQFEQLESNDQSNNEVTPFKKVFSAKLQSRNSSSSRFYSKTSRVKYEGNSPESSFRQEKKEYFDSSMIQDVKQPWSILNLNTQQQNMNDTFCQFKEIQLPQNINNLKSVNNTSLTTQEFNKQSSVQQNKSNIQPQDQFNEMKKEKDKINIQKQSKIIQEILHQMRTQNYLENEKNQQNSNYQQKIISSFQYQPIQSINVNKFNEFKLNKKRRANSIENCSLIDSKSMNISNGNVNKLVKNEKYIYSLEDQDPQKILILRNKILSYENREDKGFDLNSFLYNQSLNVIKNPIINNNNQKQEKNTQIKNIKNTYRFKYFSNQQRFLSNKINSNNPHPLLYPESNLGKQEQKMNQKMNFSAWDDELDIYKREELEDIKYLDDYNKKQSIFK